ncbi:hypothetical protein [uncultured Parvimonas sp.]|uniref:hypothetical protein n=1 Tax=uncultured Parvimonas sp. TaxID=747372 RepID=UPI00259518CE|nr:hypothetical protein [uncultured Parvimonas sp.]
MYLENINSPSDVKKLSIFVVLFASIICSLILYVAEIIDFANRVSNKLLGRSMFFCFKKF